MIPKPTVTIAELSDFLIKEFPQVCAEYRIEKITDGGVRVRLVTAEKHLRPGGTISGPSMFALADLTMYMGILSRIGLQGLTVTTNCSIDFMRKPEAGVAMVAEATILKLGQVLVVGDVLLFSDGKDDPVARASLTYSIPPKRA